MMDGEGVGEDADDVYDGILGEIGLAGAMIWHHEFLFAYYLGYIEVRHFTYFIGPKFSIFYNVYSQYEYTQLCNMWADTTEMQ